MITVRQIERLWQSRQYRRLFHDLLAVRAEAVMAVAIDPTPVAAAGLAVVRLDELSQSFAPICKKLISTILAAQEPDGGWGDLPITALALRALFCARGHGVAIDRGLDFLCNLQKSEGIWPTVPLRRTTADPLTSAFILHQLGDHPAFQSAIRFNDALQWFGQHAGALDEDTQLLWHHASLRCRHCAVMATVESPGIWS